MRANRTFCDSYPNRESSAGLSEFNEMKKNTAMALLVIATVLWGSTFAFTKELVAVLPPLLLVFTRFFLTSLLLLAIYARSIGILARKLLREPPRDVLMPLTALGVLNFLAIVLQTTGLTEIAASNSGFITSLATLFVPFLEFLTRGKRIALRMKAAIVLSLAGIYLMSYGVSLPETFRRGDFLTLVCAFAYSGYIVLVDVLSKKVPAGGSFRQN